jgi:uncharacterized protein YutD
MEDEIIIELVELLKERMDEEEFNYLIIDIYKRYGYAIVPLMAGE